MKTSRISRDTPKYARALSSTTATTPAATRNNERGGRKPAKAVSPPMPVKLKPQPPDPSPIKRESNSGDTDTDSPLSSVPPSPKLTILSKKRKRAAPTTAVNAAAIPPPTEPPPQWRELYDCAKEIRAETEAPVDTMGCNRLAERWRSPKDQRFQTLIALMLSPQTRDTATAAVMHTLQTTPLLQPAGLTLSSLLTLAPENLISLIRPVGFHTTKAHNILAVCQILTTQYDSDIPSTISDLMSLPGVGPKIAHLCLTAAWGRTEGIGVDVHVHRISNLWGWTGKRGTKGPEDTRKVLQGWLPKELWAEINGVLVGLGQTICLPRGRRCGVCKAAERGLCPSALAGPRTKSKAGKSDPDQADEELTATIKDEKTKFEKDLSEDEKPAVPDIEDLLRPVKMVKAARKLRSRVP
ncbi:MAG: DNA N-glycosylase and apurinic/apyrimidinic (AP) lyase [Geoglossum umbratile]|nr:MAG: DNA N-glycosylase and apurinic/apyrimidinic (AP) lyase [Geoglossum umbratile]